MEKGIKETKELLIGLNTLAVVIGDVLKDGAQLSDLIDGFSAIKGDAEKERAIADALAGIQEVPAEIKDIDLGESIELIKVQAEAVPALIAAFKKA